MNKPKAMGLTLLLVLQATVASCALSDLRTEEVLAITDRGDSERKARALLESVIARSGGRARWSSFASAKMTLEDQWQGFIGWLFRPWPGNPTRVRMHYQLGMASVEAEFLGDPDRGNSWGVDSAGYWWQAPDSERNYVRRDSARFILQAYQYFFELPVELAKADIVLYAGERLRENRNYDLVFATWEREEPHAGHDQYLLWIARDTGRLEIAQYTIREKFDFACGVNHYSDFQDVGGFAIPHGYWIAQGIDDADFVHKVQLTEVEFIRR